MEIIYYWINKDYRINKQGFNLSPEIKCAMSMTSEGKLLMEVTSTGKLNIMRSRNNRVVSNVTVFVGENGAGKTSLMRALGHLSCIALVADTGDEKSKNRNEINKCLYIIRDNSKYYLITNIWKNSLIVRDNDSLISEMIFTSDDVDKYRAMVKEDQLINNITSVYLTNLSYVIDTETMTAYKGITNISLFPEGLSVVTDKFFDFIISSSIDREESVFVDYSLYLKKQKTKYDFQMFCDLYYCAHFYGKGKNRFGCLGKEFLYLNVADAIDKLYDFKDYIINQKISINDSMTDEELWNVISHMSNRISRQNTFETITDHLKFNFLVEYYLQNNEKEVDDLLKEKRISEAYDCIVEKIDNIRMPVYCRYYFSNAIKEIHLLETILDGFDNREDDIEQTKILYNDGYVLRENQLKEFLLFIKRCLEYNHKIANGGKIKIGSFCLRYLKVGNLELSSGERAFQNIMSWLFWLSKMGDITSSEKFIPKDNILLCIDEVDVMCHPDWQRDIIGNIITAVEEYFKGKNIQLIFSTHTPLCLSNVPVENTVYLINNDNGIQQDTSEHIQTFGRNIYDILNDSFYLNGKTIGKYALDYINEIITEIREGSDEFLLENKKQLIKRIEIIGDSLIKRKLFQLLEDRMPIEDSELMRLEHLIKKRAMLDEEIRRLKEND